MRIRLLILACLLAPTSATATMPLLGEMPKARTKEACRAWADKQIA